MSSVAWYHVCTKRILLRASMTLQGCAGTRCCAKNSCNGLWGCPWLSESMWAPVEGFSLQWWAAPPLEHPRNAVRGLKGQSHIHFLSFSQFFFYKSVSVILKLDQSGEGKTFWWSNIWPKSSHYIFGSNSDGSKLKAIFFGGGVTYYRGR